MRTRFWLALGALAFAIALLAPAFAPLGGSMDAFADDLSNGTFRPFGPSGGRSAGSVFSGSLGGFTGQSDGNYLPGAADVPDEWVMDRDGRGGHVVIDYVFEPALGSMKRLKAYDQIAEDGQTLEVADTRLRPLGYDPSLRYDRVIQGSFEVQFAAGEPVPIYSVHPKAVVTSYSLQPALGGEVRFFRDGADTVYALAQASGKSRLNLTYLTSSDYYTFEPPQGMSVSDYPPQLRPEVPESLAEDAQVVLARAGAGDGSDLGATLDALNRYFRSFTEGDIPAPTEVESLYLALALGGHGCCRHRAFAYMVTAQAIGIPARTVVNEAHAFAEVMLPDGRWHQVNLGGCGTYEVNNPQNHRPLLDAAEDPRAEANPDENRPLPTIVSFTNITEAPERIVKGETYRVSGTVEGADGRPVAGARIDLFLNETKDSPGRLTGAGTTDAQGFYSVVARVPKELPARSYQLVARALDPGGGVVRYEESWSDPEVQVFTPTSFVFPRMTAASGFPFNVTGRLIDVDGNPVAGAQLHWRGPDQQDHAARTDATGRFALPYTFDDLGEQRVEVRYDGDEHHGASRGTGVVVVERGAILVPLDAPLLARGETGTLAGHVAVAGVSLADRTVTVTVRSNDTARRPLVTGEATTDDDGAFAATLDVARALRPGVYPVTYAVPALDLEHEGLVRLAIRPTLALDVPRSVGQGKGWVLEARLLSDNGTALAGSLIELSFDGNATSTRALLTNRTGTARFEVAPRALEPGPHAARLAFPGDASHAPVDALAQVQVALPWYAALAPAAWGAIAAAILAAALLAWALRPGGPGRRLAARAGVLAERGRWRVTLEWPDHPEGVAPVFEPGEPARVRVRVVDREGARVAARVQVDWPRGRARGRADVAEGFLASVPLEAEGTVPLCARAAGLARLWTSPARLDLPVHAYRRAVEDTFVALRRRAQLDAAATPDDLVRALAPRLAHPQRASLREAARLFEVADYSEGAVDRAFYHAFAAHAREVERALDGGAPAAGA